MPATDTDQLALLIEQKLACLTSLREMSRQQLDMVRDGKMTALLEILSTKQQSIVRLHQIERAIDPFRSEPPANRRWRTPDDRRRCADQLSRCETLLADLVALEKESERQLVERRDEAARQLQFTHAASAARGGYREAAPRAGRQLDLASDG